MEQRIKIYIYMIKDRSDPRNICFIRIFSFWLIAICICKWKYQVAMTNRIGTGSRNIRFSVPVFWPWNRYGLRFQFRYPALIFRHTYYLAACVLFYNLRIMMQFWSSSKTSVPQDIQRVLLPSSPPPPSSINLHFVLFGETMRLCIDTVMSIRRT